MCLSCPVSSLKQEGIQDFFVFGERWLVFVRSCVSNTKDNDRLSAKVPRLITRDWYIDTELNLIVVSYTKFDTADYATDKGTNWQLWKKSRKTSLPLLIQPRVMQTSFFCITSAPNFNATLPKNSIFIPPKLRIFCPNGKESTASASQAYRLCHPYCWKRCKHFISIDLITSIWSHFFPSVGCDLTPCI